MKQSHYDLDPESSSAPLSPSRLPARKQNHPDHLPESSEARTCYQPLNKRRILCVFPEYDCSFGTLHYAYPFIPNVKAFMPPQGLLLIAPASRKAGRCVLSTRTYSAAPALI